MYKIPLKESNSSDTIFYSENQQKNSLKPSSSSDTLYKGYVKQEIVESHPVFGGFYSAIMDEIFPDDDIENLHEAIKTVATLREQKQQYKQQIENLLVFEKKNLSYKLLNKINKNTQNEINYINSLISELDEKINMRLQLVNGYKRRINLNKQNDPSYKNYVSARLIELREKDNVALLFK